MTEVTTFYSSTSFVRTIRYFETWKNTEIVKNFSGRELKLKYIDF